MERELGLQHFMNQHYRRTFAEYRVMLSGMVIVRGGC